MPQTELLPKFVKPKRVIGGEHPLIALAQEQLKALMLQTDRSNLWYISRLQEGFEFFLGAPTLPLSQDIMQDLATKPSCSRRCLANMQTAFGEIVEAEVSGVVNKNAITEQQRNLLSRYFNPYRETSADVHPEVFTYASAFNHVVSDWSMINTPQHIKELSPTGKDNLLADLLIAGLGVLEQEAEYKHINLAAKRLRMLGESPKLGFHITPDIYDMLKQERRVPEQNLKNLAPEPHSLVYFPSFDPGNPQMGAVIVPTEWIWTAFKRAIPALCSLIYVSSLVRDDYYGEFRGSDVYFARGFGSVEISQQPIAIKRAEGLVAELHQEVAKYDLRVYFINSKADKFMRDLQRRYPHGALDNLYYPDPPDRQNERIYHG